MVEEILNATNQPATPTAEAYSAALVPFVRALPLPHFHDSDDAESWAKALASHLIGRDVPRSLASEAAATLRRLASDENRWELWCRYAGAMLWGHAESEVETRERQLAVPDIRELTRGLIDAIRQVQVHREAAP